MFDMGTGDDAEEVLVEGVPPESYLERFQVRACGMTARVAWALQAKACGSLSTAWLISAFAVLGGPRSTHAPNVA